jgi:predicted CXXCH cytochrome family protein
MTMVKTVMRIGSWRMLSIGQICMFFLLTIVAVSWGEQEETKTESKCSFTKYLQNPENQARYENTLAKARGGIAETNSYDNAAMYGLIAKADSVVGAGLHLDSFSAGCLSCHDGTAASKVIPRFKNTPEKKSVMSMLAVKHPIGMDYEQYAISHSADLKSLDEMSRDLTLVDGKVSCITCHDPISSRRSQLRITSTGVDLCSACHKM